MGDVEITWDEREVIRIKCRVAVTDRKMSGQKTEAVNQADRYRLSKCSKKTRII